MSVGPFLRPAEETWCVWTRTGAICACPGQTRCTARPTWAPTPTRTRRRPCLAPCPTTPRPPGPWSAASASSWMRTISVLVSRTNPSSRSAFLLKLVWHRRNNRPAVVLQLMQQSSPVFWSQIFYKDTSCMFHIIIPCKLRYDSVLLFKQESHFHEKSNVFMRQTAIWWQVICQFIKSLPFMIMVLSMREKVALHLKC